MKINHFANRVNKEHFEIVVEMFREKLNFIELRRGRLAIHMRQPGFNIDLQFTRSDTVNRDVDKRYSQVSFLSENPRAALEELAAWANGRGLKAVVGSYSDKEFYLDAPDAFIDFVVEAMTPDCADYEIDK